jgi:NADH-quinone oxidoreductase subunit I
MGLIGTFITGIRNIAVGMSVTITNMFKRPMTLQYPEERWSLPIGYRGIPALKEDPETGRIKCSGCGVCARACPVNTISVTAKVGEDGKRTVDTYSIDMTKCTICGLCADACPFDSLTMFDHYELASTDKASLIYNVERLRISNLELEKQRSDRRVAKRGVKRNRISGFSTSNSDSRS